MPEPFAPKLQEDVFQCPSCKGDGLEYIDPPDAVEGHKLSRTIPCPMCKGKQRFDPYTPMGNAVSAFWKTLNAIKRREYLEEKTKYERERELVKLMLKGLTPEQIEMLRDHLNNK